MQKAKQVTTDEIEKLKFLNKQRTMVFAQRGINPTQRHLLGDLRKLMPHSKKENKFNSKSDIVDVNTLCEIKNCQNCIFFRKEGKDLYWYISKVETGPTIKFRVTNSKFKFTHSSQYIGRAKINW